LMTFAIEILALLTPNVDNTICNSVRSLLSLKFVIANKC
jgi:hypothetical protein